MFPRITKRTAVVGLAALSLTAVMTLLGACGGDDDSTGGGAAKGSSPAAKDDSKVANAGPVSGTDKEYVKDMCVSFNSYMDGVFKVIQSDPSSATDQAAIAKKLGPFLESFAKDVDKAKPPRDVKKYHDELVKQVKDSSEKLKSGKVKSLAELGQGVTPPKDLDPAILTRLSNAEKDVKECSEGQLAGIGGLFSAGK